MVKKSRKRENRQLAIAQQAKVSKKVAAKRLLKGPLKASPGVSVAHIKNKQKRSEIVHLHKTQKKKDKAMRRRDLKERIRNGEEVQRQVPRTIESMREPDETILPVEDEEVAEDEALDEFESYFSGHREPKILLTTHRRPSAKLFTFLKELIHVIPNMYYYPRKDFPYKNICESATERGFTDIVLFDERSKVAHGVYITHLPSGPTSYFRLTRLKLGQDMRGGATCNASHNPELILSNFVTRLGRRIGRQLISLFPTKPDFHGRRSITFHNQRDFVFFRHHRYGFKNDGSKCSLQEIGPRFTLKLRYVQHGTFDSKEGEYEYIWRPDSQVNRKVFFV